MLLVIVAYIIPHDGRVRQESDIPKSIPMTWPLTFSSPPFELYLTNDEPSGERIAEERENAEVARGSCGTRLSDENAFIQAQECLTDLGILDGNILQWL